MKVPGSHYGYVSGLCWFSCLDTNMTLQCTLAALHHYNTWM